MPKKIKKDIIHADGIDIQALIASNSRQLKMKRVIMDL